MIKAIWYECYKDSYWLFQSTTLTFSTFPFLHLNLNFFLFSFIVLVAFVNFKQTNMMMMMMMMRPHAPPRCTKCNSHQRPVYQSQYCCINIKGLQFDWSLTLRIYARSVLRWNLQTRSSLSVADSVGLHLLLHSELWDFGLPL